jgi:hypothetical protein
MLLKIVGFLIMSPAVLYAIIARMDEEKHTSSPALLHFAHDQRKIEKGAHP